ncbi:hypothetical protein N0Y54_00015 [Nostoc punctiforme UO1]|uniref:hypothetical protein n=1 Tax=Nostoc punctiforme TaxID=272131 RepID=UPI0030AACAA9
MSGIETVEPSITFTFLPHHKYSSATLGVNHLNQAQKQHLLKQMCSRLEQLGYKVTLEPQPSPLQN